MNERRTWQWVCGLLNHAPVTVRDPARGYHECGCGCVSWRREIVYSYWYPKRDRRWAIWIYNNLNSGCAGCQRRKGIVRRRFQAGRDVGRFWRR